MIILLCIDYWLCHCLCIGDCQLNFTIAFICECDTKQYYILPMMSCRTWLRLNMTSPGDPKNFYLTRSTSLRRSKRKSTGFYGRKYNIFKFSWLTKFTVKRFFMNERIAALCLKYVILWSTNLPMIITIG